MKKRVIVYSLLLLVLLSLSTYQFNEVKAGELDQSPQAEKPKNIDARHMLFLSEMQAYTNSSQGKDWTTKIYPDDKSMLEDSKFKDSYQQIYVSDVQDVVQSTKDTDGKVISTIRVLVPSEKIAKRLSEVDNSLFYVCRYSPSIITAMDKEELQHVANDPSVYCIRIFPRTYGEPLNLTISQSRTYGKIANAMAQTGPLNANTKIAVIDTGYDYYQSKFGYPANDNIAYWHDFHDGDGDVADGDNSHGTDVLDIMAQAFGDIGTSDEMYGDPYVYYVMKVAYMNNGWVTMDMAAEAQAIEACLSLPIDVVCMAFTAMPNQQWCTWFKMGTDSGKTWVAGIGNNGWTSQVHFPASSHYVVGVGAYREINGEGHAVRADFSNYGIASHSSCQVCLSSGLQNEFKPNAYECGEILDSGFYLNGTSFATALTCADIAVAFYSTGQRTVSYENLLQLLSLCNTYPVVPYESSKQGGVIDTYALWQWQANPPTWSDNFNDGVRGPKWSVLQNGGYSPYESEGKLYVSTPGGGGYVQSGYVTTDSYNLLGGQAAATVPNQGGLYEINLQISTTKVTGSDPYFEQNWYRINKLVNGNTVVQRSVNGQITTMWQGYTGGNQLSVAIASNGTIQLSDGIQTYSEYCQIAPQNNFYIYLFTSSNLAGTGTFDNFKCWVPSSPPSQPWGDEFNDTTMSAQWNLKQDGGSAYEENGVLNVYTSVSEWHSGGYVTSSPYNLIGHTTSVTACPDSLEQLVLLVCPNKYTDAGPWCDWGIDDNYRILKWSGYTVIQRYVGNTETILYQSYRPYDNELSITVTGDNYIHFSDNGVDILYSDYCLISSTCYIYLVGSSPTIGVGAFDHFSFS